MTGAIVRYLFDTESRRLQGYFRRNLPPGGEVADAVQETFARMLTAPDMAAIANPQAYLFQVARSVISSSVAGGPGRFASAYGAEPDDLACDQPGQERILAARQELRVMTRTIEALPDRCQQVFILSRLHGLPNGEIATRLGISRNMVEKHIIRALLQCREVRAGLRN